VVLTDHYVQETLSLMTLNTFQDQYNMPPSKLGSGGEDGGGPVIDPPKGKFKPINWVDWHARLMSYLRTQYGKTHIPLYYVVKENNPTATELTTMNEKDKLIHEAPHFGETFAIDNETVWHVLKGLVMGSNGWFWIQQYESTKNGKLAMQALRAHYSGADQKKWRKNHAHAQIKSIHYKDENIFSFENYVSILQSSYSILQEEGDPLSEDTKLQYFFEKMISVNNDRLKATIQAVKVKCNADPTSTFVEASQEIATEVKDIYPNVGTKTNRRNISEITTYGNDRTKNKKHGYQRKGRKDRIAERNGGKRKVEYNGVDISDLTRKFSDEEYSKLRSGVKRSIRFARAEKFKKRGGKRYDDDSSHGTNGSKNSFISRTSMGSSTRSISSVSSNGSTDPLRSPVIEMEGEHLDMTRIAREWEGRHMGKMVVEKMEQRKEESRKL